MIPRSKELYLYLRNEQFDRIRHYLMNVSGKDLHNKDSFEYDHIAFEKKPDGKVRFKVVTQEVGLTMGQISKIKFFHTFMFNCIYSSESSFYEGLFKAEWNFGSVFEKTLRAVKKDILNSGIFENTRIYTKGAFNDDSLFMFSLPVLNRQIDWQLINACISHAKLRLTTF